MVCVYEGGGTSDGTRWESLRKQMRGLSNEGKRREERVGEESGLDSVDNERHDKAMQAREREEMRVPSGAMKRKRSERQRQWWKTVSGTAGTVSDITH
ncbi:hypothetical protein E2C01_062823 [Portunus trituberculatus]|uniref:Uncharacterized protein n=1 Tax=Portunus trituberculatus TaxID=210409 RepID=A0A5B7H8Y6_PORTR|nr:hypothetical protein [Portunus trituberculatus]